MVEVEAPPPRPPMPPERREGPDVSHMRAMLALAARARRQRRIVLCAKVLIGVGLLAGVVLLVLEGLELLQAA